MRLWLIIFGLVALAVGAHYTIYRPEASPRDIVVQPTKLDVCRSLRYLEIQIDDAAVLAVCTEARREWTAERVAEFWRKWHEAKP